MRMVMVPLLIVFFADIATAQTQLAPPESPNIIVIKKSWTKRRFRPGWDRFDEQLNRTPSVDQREPGVFKGSGQGTQDISLRRRSGPVIEGYVYKATVKNTGSRTVKRFGWDYTITDSGGENTTHHQFYTRVKIAPGKKKTVSRFVRTPPSRTVDAGNKMAEDVIINYVEYEDGSVWRKQ